jgi:hypothetical protein
MDLAAMERTIGTIDAHTGKVTDPYKAEAAKIFMVPEAQVTEKQRVFAKHQAYVQAYSRR